jgi:lipopolysaccharide transport system ATP-binding protein
MSELAIRVENLSKAYHITHVARRSRYKTLREDVIALPRRLWILARGQNDSRQTFWALRDVSFEVEQGEVVGIIGRNGAGKSTLLKILSRITAPTQGRAEIYGRVGSLLEVGTGFHPELTGRENIYLSGAILGMTHEEVQRKFDEIVAFAEVEKFLDTPAKHYSSGMYVRLAFAVAAHLESEILMVDEVLAVGDAAFQKKCLGKMGEVAHAGRTILFVSHNMGAVLQLCTRGIILAAGARVFDGNAPTAVSTYLHETSNEINTARFDPEPHKTVQITSMTVVTPNGSPISTVPHIQPFAIQIEYVVRDWPLDSYLCLDVFNESDVRLLWSSDVGDTDTMAIKRPPGTYRAQIMIPGQVLAPGLYRFTASVYAPGRSQLFETRERAVAVEISDGGSFLSNFGIRPHAATMIPLEWQTEHLS